MATEQDRRIAAVELGKLKNMVLTWKASYIGIAEDGGGGEFLAFELLEEIEQYVYPFVRRMKVCRQITETQASEFLNFCYAQVQDLKAFLQEEG